MVFNWKLIPFQKCSLGIVRNLNDFYLNFYPQMTFVETFSDFTEQNSSYMFSSLYTNFQKSNWQIYPFKKMCPYYF